eukprot:TRINITY_DN5841_c0_g1_i4.p1 TRINITY_DN5841_c0_g1~~TRINITY_DN5841_c0_g1_i4.p1  ORF type:complete len:110 (+),score=33.33 TRINITY_DN5841_c0_g1_i4:137-466(+)
MLAAKLASKSRSPHSSPVLEPQAEPTPISREELNAMDTKEYLDTSVMTPMLEALHLISKTAEANPLEFLAQYLIDNDPFKHEQAQPELNLEASAAPTLRFEGRHGLFKL